MISQPIAPRLTAKRKAGAGSVLTSSPFPLNVATSACVMNAAVSTPRTVQMVPQIAAVRFVDTPEPTRVAMPFEMSFAPFAKATIRVQRTSVMIIDVFLQAGAFRGAGDDPASSYDPSVLVRSKLMQTIRITDVCTAGVAASSSILSRHELTGSALPRTPRHRSEAPRPRARGDEVRS